MTWKTRVIDVHMRGSFNVARATIELFRDLAGSWFWVGPPPAPSTPVSTSASADGASNGAVTGGNSDA